MKIPDLHLPTTDPSFIKDPYPTLKEFREKTPIFWDEINSLLFITRYSDVRNVQTNKIFGTTFNHIEGFEERSDSSKPLTYVGYKRADKYATYDYFWKSEEDAKKHPIQYKGG